MEIKIREEHKDDFSIIGEVVELAFRNEELSDHKEHFLVEKLRQLDAYIPQLALVAESEGKIIGHIMLTKVEIVSGGKSVPSLALAPVSVHPKCQKQGVGSALIREAHKRAAALGHRSVVLLGHKDYYPKFGYKKAVDFGIEFPFDVPHEFCMAVELLPGGLKDVHGKVKFSEPLMG